LTTKITCDNIGEIAYLPQGTYLFELIHTKDGGRYMLQSKKTKNPNKFIILGVLQYTTNSLYIKLYSEDRIYYSKTDQTFLVENENDSRIN
tara:strand:- start:2793 stop:3065 length:273 start_codon:yes stop_codon:yes gene_type:complete